SGDLLNVGSRAAKGPELRAIFNVTQPCAPPNRGHMIFHLAEHSPAAVHAASLRGIPPIFRLGPWHVGILARRINEEIADDERVLVARRIYIADAAGGDRRA